MSINKTHGLACESFRAAIRKAHRARVNHIAIACALCWSCLQGPGTVWALSLGPMHTQSALGEPLWATVVIGTSGADEATTLHVEHASADVYHQMGLARNPALDAIHITLTPKAGGVEATIRSQAALIEPYVDVILVARSTGAELQRNYTLLLDPPRSRLSGQDAPTLAPASPPLPTIRTKPAAIPAPKNTKPSLIETTLPQSSVSASTPNASHAQAEVTTDSHTSSPEDLTTPARDNPVMPPMAQAAYPALGEKLPPSPVNEDSKPIPAPTAPASVSTLAQVTPIAPVVKSSGDTWLRYGLYALIGLFGIVAAGLAAARIKKRSMLRPSQNKHGNDFPRTKADFSASTQPRAHAISTPKHSPQDALAEAGVYLTYGRAADAQRVLMEALVASPGHIALERRLREIRNAPPAQPPFSKQALPNSSPIAENTPAPIAAVTSAPQAATRSAPAASLPFDPAAPLEFDANVLSDSISTPDTSSKPEHSEQLSPAPSPSSPPFLDLDTAEEQDSRLTLAREFLRIGDLEHARSIAQQVLRDPQTQWHGRAQQLLAHLDTLKEPASHP